MHISGKIFAWLVALGAVAAVALSTKMLDVRSSWAKAFAENQAKYDGPSGTVRKVEEARDQLRDAQRELARTLLGWSANWSDVDVTIDQQQGVIRAGIGTTHGLVPGANMPVLYGFLLDQQGGSHYVGAFRVVQLSQDGTQSALRPDWRFRPVDAEWFQNGKWRFWATVPPSFTSQFSNLEVELAAADELLAGQSLNLEAQNAAAAAAEAQLQRRLGELFGPVQPSADPQAPVELRQGLVQGLQLEEQARNTAQAEVDRLRRAVLEALNTQERLIQENRRLASGLPSNEPTVTAEASSR